MEIIINTSSMIPLYEQIAEEVKKQIVSGALRENDALPSVRTLSKELKISALTVKKAYDTLEEEGLTATIHGKGTYVRAPDAEKLREEQRRELEKAMEGVVSRARLYGVGADELRTILDILLEE